MRLVVFSHKPTWISAEKSDEYVTDGGFPFQMEAISELFDETVLLVPIRKGSGGTGVQSLTGINLTVAGLSYPWGKGFVRKLLFPLWIVWNWGVIWRNFRSADAIHAVIPGDIGTVGIILAIIANKRLFVRHCGNWLKPRTIAEYAWRRGMEMFAGPNRIMIATGWQETSPSIRCPAISWIFSTSLSKAEIKDLGRVRSIQNPISPRLIIVARQEVEKGTGIVLNCLPKLLSEFPGLQFDIVGDGPALGHFVKLTKDLRVEHAVKFHGKLSHENVLKCLNMADLFVFPTQASEGFPKVVLEALACGVPVISTNVSVIGSLLSRGGGVVVDEVSPDRLSESVAKVLRNSEGYSNMSRLAITTASEYSLEAWGKRIGERLEAKWGRLKE